MRSSEDVQRFLQALMGWGLDKPWHYGGTPLGADSVFWYWRLIWAVLSERHSDFFDAMNAATPCQPLDEEPKPVPIPSCEMTIDPEAYASVVSFWKEVDKRLGIEYLPDTDITGWMDAPPAAL